MDGLARGPSTSAADTGPDVAVALDALESDAVRWTSAAARLRAAAHAAADQVLPAGAFSLAGDEVAVAYEALRSRTAALLRAGADNCEAVGAALRAGADAYALAETAAARRLDAVDGRPPR